MPARPRQPYLVCATQRSGSTLLCETLRATGIAGRPLEHFQIRRASGRPPQPREYFVGLDDPGVLAHLAPTPAPSPSSEPSATWWDRVLREGSTENGVWGGKLMWDQVDDLTSHAREILGRPSADLREGIDRLLGHTRFVFVTRPDTVAQAVSLWKAVQSQEWRAGDRNGSTVEPRYSLAAIRHLVGWLERADQGWREWFAHEGIEPLAISYDDLRDDPAEQVRRALRHLGLPDLDVPGPPLQRQSDDSSREWAERYRREAEVRA